MNPAVVRATATAWLDFFELCLSPLRAAAAPPSLSQAEERELQQEAWLELAGFRRGTAITEPIFTDEVAARAKSA